MSDRYTPQANQRPKGSTYYGYGDKRSDQQRRQDEEYLHEREFGTDRAPAENRRTSQAEQIEEYPPRDFVTSLLREHKKAITETLMSGVNADRFLQTMEAPLAKTKELHSCDRDSLRDCCVAIARIGLESGYYITATRDKQRGIKLAIVKLEFVGRVELAKRHGNLLSISTQIICEKDTFRCEDNKIDHSLARLGSRGEPTGAYAILKFKGGIEQIEVMSKADINFVRDETGGETKPWLKSWGEMARKTVGNRGLKGVPMTPWQGVDVEELDRERIERVLKSYGVDGAVDLQKS